MLNSSCLKITVIEGRFTLYHYKIETFTQSNYMYLMPLFQSHILKFFPSTLLYNYHSKVLEITMRGRDVLCEVKILEHIFTNDFR